MFDTQFYKKKIENYQSTHPYFVLIYQTNHVDGIKYFIKNNIKKKLSFFFFNENDKTSYNHQIYLIFIKTKRINKNHLFIF